MKYFFDTEFIEGFHKPLFGKKRHFVNLISIGMVSEDGRELSVISSEYNYNDADEWVKEFVILPLYRNTVHGDNRNRFTVSNFHKHYGVTNKQIATEIMFFINNQPRHGSNEPKIWHDYLAKQRFLSSGNGNPEFYGYYADYDWVLFCSLFGRMIDLPKGFPMYCKDLKQMLDEALMSKYGVNRTTVTLLYSKLNPINTVEIRAIETLDKKIEWLKKHCNEYPKQSNEHDALADAKWNFELFKFIEKCNGSSI